MFEISIERIPPQRILPATQFPAFRQARANANDLHDIDATRRIEASFAKQLPPHTLMVRAGLSVARLALALHPHAQTIWVACGPGNNGGDGLESAGHLQRWGKQVMVTWLGAPERCSADTLAAFEKARQSGVQFADVPPLNFDLAIDALLGIGAASTTSAQAPGKRDRSHARLNDWVNLLNQRLAPVLSIDLPSGLNADTGVAGTHTVWARHTLSLLTLKPGLFTAAGRDHCGDIWFDAIGCDDLAGAGVPPAARLSGPPTRENPPHRRRAPHASHKGSFGDVVVIGGAPGMTGAALLAASAALHGGAGRVLVGLLDGGSMVVDSALPELMFRSVASLDLRRAAVVCGCGGGDAVREYLPTVLSTAALAVFDADALNAISADTNLQLQLKQRVARGKLTVITPHPLEAARLLGCSTAEVQADRLAAACQLAERFACCVVLKGSGSVIAAPSLVPQINPSGNALLATAGTGDVLAGLIGAHLANLKQLKPRPAEVAADAEMAAVPGSVIPTEFSAVFSAVCGAVSRHGDAASQWPQNRGLTASSLAQRL